jgi:hypothetical protein
MAILRATGLLVLAASLCLTCAGAQASDPIGETVALTPAARGSSSGQLSTGSGIYQGETITTGPSGTAELQFLDSTHLALGPSSAVALDEFVYSGNGQANAVAVGLTKGLFRFATGSSAKKSYRVETPLAAIGVRGTGLLIDSRTGSTTVTLEHGEAIVCLRRDARGCITLATPGDTVVVSSDGAIGRTTQVLVNNFFCSRSTQGSTLCTPYGTGGTDNPNPSESGGGTPSRSAPGSGTKGRSGGDGPSRQ